MIPDKDRIRGSLIGGAIGDALGYPVEFVRSYRKIQEKFGPKSRHTLSGLRCYWEREMSSKGDSARKDLYRVPFLWIDVSNMI